MTPELYLVDSFTDSPFAGNPAGVCLPDSEEQTVDAAWMQAVAAEVGASETAFASPETAEAGAEGATWNLRWFTPTTEVPLCGHATLATAHVLWETGRAGVDRRLCFATASGLLAAGRRADGRIELDFPALPVSPVSVPAGADAAIGGATVVSAAASDGWLLLELASAEDVERAAPDAVRIGRLHRHGVIVTAVRTRSEDADFVSRVFVPNEGIDEDPVTGAAHCVLGPYWAPRLGRTKLVARQASRRGGIVGVEVLGPRVLLTGAAVTILAGRMGERAAVRGGRAAVDGD